MATSVINQERIQSPCVRLCTLDEQDICLGCHRSIDEICAWGMASNDERQQILRQVELRAPGRKRA